MPEEKKPVKAPTAGAAKQTRGKRIAEERLYGTDAHGRRVLVAAVGQPIPDHGYEIEGQKRSAPAQDHARKAPGSSQRRRRKS